MKSVQNEKEVRTARSQREREAREKKEACGTERVACIKAILSIPRQIEHRHRAN